MSVQEQTIAKIRQLPEPLLQKVNNFIDSLLIKNDLEGVEVVESDFSDYLNNLEDYEERLARGEIGW